MGWNNFEQFVTIQQYGLLSLITLITDRDGTVIMYSILGEEIRKFNLEGVRRVLNNVHF